AAPVRTAARVVSGTPALRSRCAASCELVGGPPITSLSGWFVNVAVAAVRSCTTAVATNSKVGSWSGGGGGSTSVCASMLIRQARYFLGTGLPSSSKLGCGRRFAITTATNPSSSPPISSLSPTSTSRTWASSRASSLVGKTPLTTVCVTERYTLVAVSRSSGCGSATPGVTQSSTFDSTDSEPSPSAITTSASHGTCSSASTRRSHGSVRRFSTTCGS